MTCCGETRCVFVEILGDSNPQRCPDVPVYQVWIGDCRKCIPSGRPPRSWEAGCQGHRACIRHGAEVRTGELDQPGGTPLSVRRIRSLDLNPKRRQDEGRHER